MTQTVRVVNDGSGHFVLNKPTGYSVGCGRIDATGRFRLCYGAFPLVVGESIVTESDILQLVTIEAGRTWCEEWMTDHEDDDGEPTHSETDASLATLATREARARFGADDDAVRAFLVGVSLAWTGEVTEPFTLAWAVRS